jgi:flagellar hook-associated protein 1 FlgK
LKKQCERALSSGEDRKGKKAEWGQEMQDYSIGISGLSAAQTALEVIANNVANAATEGYHRQRVELAPAYSVQTGELILGGGVNVTGITREIDWLLEQEILRQQSLLEQVSREIAALSTVENAFGELSVGSSLSTAIDEFFNALQDLCAHPSEVTWQTQVITAAETLASQFTTLEGFLTTLETQITFEAENIIEQVDTLTSEIAELNDNIERAEITGGQANNLRDQRDQLIKKLAELVGVETQTREYGVVDVTFAGMPVVTGASAMQLQVDFDQDGLLGVTPVGVEIYNTNVQGGRMGALLSLKNTLVSEVHDDLNALASAIIEQVNQYHVQGVGSDGSFVGLIGWRMASENLADFDPPVADGKIYIRVTNTTTGQISRYEIDIDVSTDSLTTIAADISAVTGLSASAASSRLNIQADADYKFDFLPAVLPEPTASNLTGASPPAISVSGIYDGTENQTFTFTVVGSGSTGNGSLQLEARDGAGEVVATLNVGAGYAPGDELNVGNGIRISLSTGDLNAGDTFEVDAFADSDTSGVLAAVGINTFFSGHSAADIAVCSDMIDSPGRLATALGAQLTDNSNALRLANLKEQTVNSLNGMTAEEFYRQLVTDIGQHVSVKQMRMDNIETMVQNLANRQSEISGVNINDEAAQILIFEQMFNAMAKYLTTVQSAILTLMDVV